MEQDSVELVFARTGKFFCWNLLDFLLRGHVRDFCCDRWGRLVFAAIIDLFCWNQRKFLLEPVNSFWYIKPIFLEFLLQLAVILLPPSFDFAGTGIFRFGVGGEGGWCFGSPAAARLRAPATSRGSGGPSESSAG